MKREELVRSREYWISQIQLDLYYLMDDYMELHHKKQTDIANLLGVSKGYVSQIMKGEYDHKISKLVDLALAFGKVPVITFVDMEEFVKKDAKQFGEAPQKLSLASEPEATYKKKRKEKKNKS